MKQTTMFDSDNLECNENKSGPAAFISQEIEQLKLILKSKESKKIQKTKAANRIKLLRQYVTFCEGLSSVESVKSDLDRLENQMVKIEEGYYSWQAFNPDIVN